MDDNLIPEDKPLLTEPQTSQQKELPPFTEGPEQADLDWFFSVMNKCKTEIGKIIIGQEKLVDLLLLGLVSGGHCLIEGVPGIAKTLTAKLLAQILSIQFSRIQFTPDLMPTDVMGTMVYNLKTSEFSFKPGPVFSNIVLIDEINRAPAKTQAALFESMEERQVTIDGTTHKLDFPFFVVATQNPIEQEGTYKLPEAQLDRFIFKINIDYPSLEEEKMILNRFKSDFDMHLHTKIEAVLTSEDIRRGMKITEKIHIKDELTDYIAQIVCETRHSPDLFLGASPRASLAILKSAKANAAMNGRPFVIPEDIQMMASPVLNHRVILTPEREMEGVSEEDVIQDILKKIEVPR